MVPQGSRTARKRKNTSLDSESHTPKRPVDQGSPLRRKSPRLPLSPLKPSKLNLKKPPRQGQKETASSPLPSSPAQSPQKASPKPGSPFKPSVVTGCFYGKKKALYLTPLERKMLKDTKSPPRLPSKVTADPYAMPVVTKRNVRRQSKTKNVPKMATSAKQTEPQKSITLLSFKGLKPKPKIFVGAAFFSTGKKTTSMYMKSTPRSTKPALNMQKSESPIITPERKQEKTPKTPSPVGHIRVESPINVPQAPAHDTDLEVLAAEDEGSSPTEPVGFSPKPLESVSSSPWRRQPLSSPETLSPRLQALRYGLTKEVRVLLDRCSTPSSPGTAADINTQEDFLPEGDGDVVFDLSPVPSSSPDQPSSAVYPIFGSATKRYQRKAELALSGTSSSSASLGGSLPSATKDRAVRRRREPKKQDDHQLVIDAGQKQFGAITCSFCGMVYSVDSPEDDFQHTHFHQKLLDSIKFVGWKKERVVAEFWDGKIILVLPDDPKYAIRKAEEMRKLADNELGFQQAALSCPQHAKTYLFVNGDKMIVGCLIAEHIRQAFRVLAQPEEPKDMRREDFMEHHRAWCCSTTPETAVCGVSRVWVFGQARRQGVATRMLDTVRNTFTYGSPLTKEDIAFSDPTPDGRLFATQYCNTPTFLVYNFVG